MGRVREESQKRRQRREEDKKEDAGARKGRKVATRCVFLMMCGSEGSKSRLAKARGAGPCGQMIDEKLQVVMARRACPSQNVEDTPGLEHFWKLTNRRSAGRCGTKHMSKPKKIQSLENAAGSDHVRKFRYLKSAPDFGTKHISMSRC